MYETPLFINILSKKAIAKIVHKKVIIKTHGQWWFSYCNIVNFCRWYKLLPMLVFKGISGGKTKKESKTFFGQRSKDLCILSANILFQWVHNESLDFRSLKKYCYFEI